MSDTFEGFSSGLESPATHITTITPNDTTDLVVASRALNVATSGVVRVTTVGGTTAPIYVVAGVAFPVRVTRVWNSGTTATGIVALH